MMFHRLAVALASLYMAWVSSVAVSDEVYPDIDENTRFYIDVPEGKLPELLRWRPSRMPMVSQHRGGPMPGYPENALETLDNALKYGPGILEIDVATLQDGTLILMHDYTLDRTTTGQGKLNNVNWQDVKNLHLVDNEGTVTKFRIPLLRDVLLWAKDKAILNLDIKKGTDFSRVMAMVRETGTQDHVMAITYRLEQAKSFHEIAPETMLSVRIRNHQELEMVKEAGIPLTRVVAWAGLRLLDKSAYGMLHDNGLLVMQGTLGFDETALDEQIKASGNEAEYLRIIGLGADVISTDRHWAAQYAIRYPSLIYFVRGRTEVAH